MRISDWSSDVCSSDLKRQLRSPDGTLLPLTSGEFDLLLAFVEHPQRVLSRDQLLDLTRGRSSVLFDRSIDVQVSRLRRKIEVDPNMPALITTVRSGGYIFTPDIHQLQDASSEEHPAELQSLMRMP